jgi:two-component system, NtrC family, sensor kinase
MFLKPLGLLAFTLFLLFARLNGQAVFHLKTMPREGVKLDRGWLYRVGDQPAWASPELDDRAWETARPNDDVVLSPGQMKPGVIGWFRLSFNTDGLTDSAFGMIMQQSGASEFYLDGRLVNRFGVVSQDPSAIRAWDPLLKPVPILVTGNGRHVLAVRYALQPGLRYTTMYEARNPALQIRLLFLKDAIDEYLHFTSTISGLCMLLIGLCLLMASLHFAFYLYNPVQPGNRSFALYALGFILFNIFQFYYFLYGNDVSRKFIVGNLSMDLRLACNFFLLSALYNLLGRKKDAVYWALVLLIFLGVFLNTAPYDIGWKIGGAFLEILIGAAITRVAYLATKAKTRGAWIILGGAISYFVFFSVFFSYVLRPESAFLLNLSLVRITFYVLSFLSIPLATSIFLGLDFAFANINLKSKLEEVRELSEKNILHEQEMRDILASQNETLERQVEERTHDLNRSLVELKSTQEQLVQKEKMASLGELTAGIAHEIQNPLNFVNNFAEINKELLEDVKSQNVKSIKPDGAFPIDLELLEDLDQNMEKINHHGKRADAIVKSMLQHSRAASGQKEPTDLNALAEEYLNLAYHGLLAKDKDFNVTLERDFDPNPGKVDVVPQDIGRVLLNLYQNAFHAVMERAKSGETGYEPKVRVETKSVSSQQSAVRNSEFAIRNPESVELRVIDNGPGIPEAIRAKIFQPFFTTKPTGQGTGLGLSLSYDIIKAHGGELKLGSNEKGWTEFVITIPI